MTSLSMVAGARPASADWFDDFNGGFQVPLWQSGSVAAGGSSGTFTFTVVSDQLQMTDSVIPAAGGAASAFGVVFDNLVDQRVTGIVNPNGSTDVSATLALIARGSLAGQFYAAEVNYDDGQLVIFRNDNAEPGGAHNLDNVEIPGLTRADSIYLEFDLIGTNLVARAYDAPGGTQLATAQASDSTYTQGLSGVLVNANDLQVPILGVFDDVGATTIPEPATGLLIFAALGGAIVLRRRR